MCSARSRSPGREREVAAYASDPDHATAWYANIPRRSSGRPRRPVAVGSPVAFVARFLGRRIAYTYEVRSSTSRGQRLVMRTAQGPFPMETTYTWEDAPNGSTRMTLRNRGEPAGFAKLTAPVMTRATRRAMTGDLRRLKGMLASPRPSAGD